MAKGHKYKGKLLSDLGIIKAFEEGRYYVDGCEIRRKDGTIVKPYIGNAEGHLFVRIYRRRRGKTLSIHRLIWMATTKHPIPPKWEIHHRNRNVQKNNFENLFCLHPADHRKLHKSDLLEEEFDPSTF